MNPNDPAFAATIRDVSVKMQWANEAKSTAEVIRRIPADKVDFKPHEKSMPALQLAQHIYQAEAMFVDAIVNGKVEYEKSVKALGELPKNPKKLADQYAQFVETSIAKLLKVPAADLVKAFSFMPGMPAVPAYGYLAWLNNHTVHHRGQLDVYLRMTGAKCPAIYGPSADDNPFK